MKELTQNKIKRNWHLIDAEREVLGRLSTKIAVLLMGKAKPGFQRFLDRGDYVVIINSAKIKTTGNKEKNKTYYSHSGYPGGFKQTNLSFLRKNNPNKIIMHSVKGMLPANKLGALMLKRLYVYPLTDHPYKDKFD